MAVKPIPEAYRTITPYIEIENAAEAIEFYKRAFGTKGRVRMEAPGGKVGHAELEIGDSVLMLADPSPASRRSPYSWASVSMRTVPAKPAVAERERSDGDAERDRPLGGSVALPDFCGGGEQSQPDHLRHRRDSGRRGG